MHLEHCNQTTLRQVTSFDLYCCPTKLHESWNICYSLSLTCLLGPIVKVWTHANHPTPQGLRCYVGEGWDQVLCCFLAGEEIFGQRGHPRSSNFMGRSASLKVPILGKATMLGFVQSPLRSMKAFLGFEYGPLYGMYK